MSAICSLPVAALGGGLVGPCQMLLYLRVVFLASALEKHQGKFHAPHDQLAHIAQALIDGQFFLAADAQGLVQLPER